MDPDVLAAIQISHLRALPPDALEVIVRTAKRLKLPAASVTHREGDDTQHLELVVSGVVRAFVTAPDGRTLTIRYCRPGALIGAASLFATQFKMPGTTQALVDAELLELAPSVVHRELERDARLAGVFLRELSERALSFVGEIRGGVFTTVRQRVARHLLDLASDQATVHRGGELAALLTQQELAEAVGTVREVVVRVLREFREEGTIRTERDRIVVIDPASLIEQQGWNLGS